jgi:hypothetical protein
MHNLSPGSAEYQAHDINAQERPQVVLLLCPSSSGRFFICPGLYDGFLSFGGLFHENKKNYRNTRCLMV